MTASMLRDIEANGHTEFEHLLGDLIRRGNAADSTSSVFRTAYLHLAAFEARRARRPGRIDAESLKGPP